MITKDKLGIFSYYHGDVDAFARGDNSHKGMISDEDFFLINNFVQDIGLISKNLASKEFEENAEEKLKENCDSQDTIAELKRLACLA